MIHAAPRRLTLEVTEKSWWGIKETLTMGGKRDVHLNTQRPCREVSDSFNRIRLRAFTLERHHSSFTQPQEVSCKENVNDVRLCDWLKPRSPTSLVWIQPKTFVASVSMFHFLPSLYCCYYLAPDRSSVWPGDQHCFFEPCIKDVTVGRSVCWSSGPPLGFRLKYLVSTFHQMCCSCTSLLLPLR